MKLLRIKPVTTMQNGVLVERYEVSRGYTENEMQWSKISDLPRQVEKYNEGVIIETFNSYETAIWFVASLKLIKPVQEVLDAHAENPQQPNLMVRTPRNLDVALVNVPKKLLKSLE